MPDELYVPQSEPLNRLFRTRKTSRHGWISQIYIWTTILFHSLILLRGVSLMHQYPLGAGLTLAGWPSSEYRIMLTSMGMIVCAWITYWWLPLILPLVLLNLMLMPGPQRSGLDLLITDHAFDLYIIDGSFLYIMGVYIFALFSYLYIGISFIRLMLWTAKK